MDPNKDFINIKKRKVRVSAGSIVRVIRCTTSVGGELERRRVFIYMYFIIRSGISRLVVSIWKKSPKRTSKSSEKGIRIQIDGTMMRLLESRSDLHVFQQKNSRC